MDAVLAGIENLFHTPAAGTTDLVVDIPLPRLILVRGLPGSGKSTMAQQFTMNGEDHFEADMYFQKDGNYLFDFKDLKAAHAWCQDSVYDSLKSNKSVVVSNTFTQKWEMQPYLDLGERFGALIFVFHVIGDWGSIHGVPQEAIDRMSRRWEIYEGETILKNFQPVQ